MNELYAFIAFIVLVTSFLVVSIYGPHRLLIQFRDLITLRFICKFIIKMRKARQIANKIKE